MNLNFPPFGKNIQAAILPPDLAVMMVGIAARQAASPTALFQSRLMTTPLSAGLLAPAHGAFNQNVAALLMRWKEA